MEIKKEEYDEYLSEDYLSIKDAAKFLEVSEEELRGLVHKHQVPSHQVAGAFLRLKRKDVEELKIKWRIERELFPEKAGPEAHHPAVVSAGWSEKISDFWYFNDFYVICTLMIMLLLYAILSTK